VRADQTGIYDVPIKYYLIDPTTGNPGTTLMYFAYGRVNFATDHNDKTLVIVPNVKDDRVLILTGVVTNVTTIDLVDECGDLVRE
jgi:hypothetical protein